MYAPSLHVLLQQLLLISALFKHSYQSIAREAAILHRVSLTIAVLSGRGYDR